MHAILADTKITPTPSPPKKKKKEKDRKKKTKNCTSLNKTNTITNILLVRVADLLVKQIRE